MKKWIVVFNFIEEGGNLNITKLNASTHFGEIPLYTDEEAEIITNFLGTKKCPIFNDVNEFGIKTRKEWNDFRKETINEIRALLNERRNSI